ncbi:MAG: peptide chain release factor N(5)-glutamine methyltransferase, partial [Acidimicrobiia bacterium]
EEQADSGGVVGDEDASHIRRFWQHGQVEPSLLEQLPDHERRRIQAREGLDHEELAGRRLAGEPLQYLEGTAAFADFEVVVDERVLIPRPETEGLFELAAESVTDPRRVVDLGTGSGVLAIALARRFPLAAVHGVDRLPGAIDVARQNAARLAATVRFHLGDLFSPLAPELRGTVGLIVSNPPYVAAHEWGGLPADVRHEPREALVAGPEGTEVLERIAAEVGDWLGPNGVVVCEIGETQARAVSAMFEPLGPVRVVDDLAGRPRYVLARRAH